MNKAAPRLYWLPSLSDADARLRALSDAATTDEIKAIADFDLDFVQTQALDRALARVRDHPAPTLTLGVLGSPTMVHLAASIRIAGLRRGLHIETRFGVPDQHWQEIFDNTSFLNAKSPDAVLLCLDAEHLVAGAYGLTDPAARDAALEETEARIVQGWRTIRDRCGCQVIHQMPLPTLNDALGENEHGHPGSAADFLRRLSHALRNRAADEEVDLVSLDRRAGRDGLDAWHDRALWLRTRQEVSARAGPVYGDLVARVLAARRGMSAKCLVLDLDNTIWGGEVGECGWDAITLGPGSAEGQAFADVQRYALALRARGIVLAVCSKNEEAVARLPFERHPEMLIRPDDIAAFHASWAAKPEMMRALANELGLGLDAMVFVDDSAFERGLMRQALPEVMVPEVPEDPALVPRMLSDAGYFEAVTVTSDDRLRATSYAANRARAALEGQSTDLESYLRNLNMRLEWSPFQPADMSRVAQLSGRTNQFMLTAQRYTPEMARALAMTPNTLTFQFRLLDRFGDNGLIALAVAKIQEDGALEIENLQMSCRVLGRRVEDAIFVVIARAAQARNLRRLTGTFEPMPRNEIVRTLFPRFGFTLIPATSDGVVKRYRLALDQMPDLDPPLAIAEAPV